MRASFPRRRIDDPSGFLFWTMSAGKAMVNPGLYRTLSL
jgi:hypothetical protein